MKKHYAAVAKYATFNEALRKDIQTTPPPPTSIGAHLLKIKDPKTNAPLSDDQLQGELTSTYMAGEAIIMALSGLCTCKQLLSAGLTC